MNSKIGTEIDVKVEMPKVVTHKQIRVDVPRELHLVLMLEASRTKISMGEIILRQARNGLDRLLKEFKNRQVSSIDDPRFDT